MRSKYAVTPPCLVSRSCCHLSTCLFWASVMHDVCLPSSICLLMRAHINACIDMTQTMIVQPLLWPITTASPRPNHRLPTATVYRSRMARVQVRLVLTLAPTSSEEVENTVAVQATPRTRGSARTPTGAMERRTCMMEGTRATQIERTVRPSRDRILPGLLLPRR